MFCESDRMRNGHLLSALKGESSAIFTQQILEQDVLETSGVEHKMRFSRSFLWLFVASFALVPSLAGGAGASSRGD